MSLIKRISTTITSTFDSAVRKVENHDAVIDAALKETQHAAARTRVRLARVQKDGNSLKTRYTQMQAASARWAERARAVADSDEVRALACLKRRRECQGQITSLNDALTSHDELESRIADNLKKIEARIGEVAQQRNVMRSRQSVADAMRIINNIEGVSYGDIEDTFDRWEINLGETEIMLGSVSASDRLDAEFLQEEDDTSLRDELRDLLADDDEERA